MTADDLLARWLDSAAEPSDDLPRADRAAPVAASPGQRGLWLAQEIQGDDATALATRHAYRLTGPLDVDALSHALDQLVERHEVLRTGFHVEGQTLLQDVRRAYPLNLKPEPIAASDLRSALAGCGRDRLDLAGGTVMRARLFRIAADDHVLVLTIHHVAVDGWSMSILQRDLAALYSGATLDPEPLQYLDFAEWQRQEVANGRYADGVEFWRAALDGVPQPMPLPTDRPRPPAQTFRGEALHVPLPAEVVQRVHAVSRAAGVTPHMVTLAAFLALLARWTNCGDLVVGTAVNHRPLPETEEMIGPFASIMPVRYDVQSGRTFREHLTAVRERFLQARDHEDVPFELIVGRLGAAQSAAYNPLVQVTMTYKSGVVQPMKLPGLTVADIPAVDVDVQRDLAVEISGEHGDYLSVAYTSDLWDRGTIDALVSAYVAALDQATAQLDRPLDALHLPVPETVAHESVSVVAAAPAVTADAALEQLVRHAWLEVLELPDVDSEDDFFDLGGESLGAMRICNRLSTALGGRVPLRILYENSVLKDFAAELRVSAPS